MKRVLAAIAAVLLALVAGVGVLVYAKTADERALAGQETVTVYVAKEPVPAGMTAEQAVAQGLMEQELVAAKAVPHGALTRIGERTASLRATSEIVPGELVLAERFAKEVPTQGRLAVPRDKLAVTVALPDPAKVGPFLHVGARITVFDTFNVQEADPKDTTPAGDHIQDRHEFTRATRVLLSDIEVLAIGETTVKPAPEAETEDTALQNASSVANLAMPTVMVTVAVTQQQAEKLVHGIHTGTLYFGLRGSDVTIEPGKGIDDRRLFQEAH